MGVLPCRRGGGLVAACGTGSFSWESLVNRYWSLGEKTYRTRGCVRVPGGHRRGAGFAGTGRALAPARSPHPAGFRSQHVSEHFSCSPAVLPAASLPSLGCWAARRRGGTSGSCPGHLVA